MLCSDCYGTSLCQVEIGRDRSEEGIIGFSPRTFLKNLGQDNKSKMQKVGGGPNQDFIWKVKDSYR